jgi:adenylate kinase family enzyme
MIHHTNAVMQVAQERLAGRAAISGRLDDNEHSVEQQWAVFQEQTLPVREHFKAKARVRGRLEARDRRGQAQDKQNRDRADRGQYRSGVGQRRYRML